MWVCSLPENWDEMNLKKVLESISRFVRNKYTLLSIRLILGTILILAAAGKLPEPAKFVDVVTHYGLLPWSLARAYGLVLPWLELTLGVLLILGFLTRLAAGVSILMLISFIVANGTAVYTHDIAGCGCFGFEYYGTYGTGYLTFIKVSDALAIDVVMVLMALAILMYGSGRWSLDSLNWIKLKKPTLHHK